MIGYPITRSDLEALIEAEKPGWLERATTRTEALISAGKYNEKSSIWSEIKRVYMSLQGDSKCAFCERKLESVELGAGEQDVEHFRPKGKVKAWKVPKALEDQGVTAVSPQKDAPGYYALAYHPFNYTAACKPCNSALKSNLFPVARFYDFEGTEPANMLNERPLLIYPIGDFDTDPEKLIAFHGISPQVVPNGGHDRHRALATIAFFELDNAELRKNLIRERVMVIILLHPQLEKIADKSDGSAQAMNIVAGAALAEAPHANCARSFIRLFERDRGEAKSIFDLAVSLLGSTS